MADGNHPALVTRVDALHVCALREAAREADFVASTDTIDAHGEIIDQATWQLEQYKSNPVVLYGHQSRDLPIGQAVKVDVVGGRLECTIRFATAEANPEADKVWRLVTERVLRAVSVGFRPTDGKYEVRDGEEVFVWYAPVLKEISVVAVGANPEALAKMKAAMVAAHTRDETQKRNETTMTEKELRDALDKSDKALGEERAAHLAAKASLESIQKSAGDLTKAVDDSKAKIKALEAEKATREAEHTKAAADRDAAIKRADESEAKLIELEVDALIGKKITPVEKDDFVKLRRESPELFKSMVDKRADMKLTERVTETDVKATPPTTLGSNGSGDAAVAHFNKL